MPWLQVSGDVTGLEWLTRDTLVATTSSGGAVMLGLSGLQVILASDWPRDLMLTPDWLRDLILASDWLRGEI